ncbi:GNAT family N-acetyltransferase [Arthrobacter flavus]|uniref:GNAT family N-acetyltransferase n=1 Tax=Arthrobacter flavus TaxID=95172 RepID=A0ABW4Q365_9MICC
MSTIEIRSAGDQDIQDLALVHVQAWQWAYRGLIPDVVLEGLDADQRARSWNQMLHQQMLPRPLVAVTSDSIVGFIHADTSRDNDADALTGEVTALYLVQKQVGGGAGYQLWEAALNQLRDSGHTALTVWVLETNQRGRAFYERMSMTLDGATKKHTMGSSLLTEVRYRSSLDAT